MLDVKAPSENVDLLLIKKLDEIPDLEENEEDEDEEEIRTTEDIHTKQDELQSNELEEAATLSENDKEIEDNSL